MKNKKPRSPAGASKGQRLRKEVEKFDLHDAPGHLLRRCHQRSEELYTNALGTDGPTRQQIALLVTVSQHPDASQAALVSLTGIDKNTLTQMIKRQTERGFLERRKAKGDGRTNAISATPAALRLLDSVMPKVRQVQDEILAPLPTELRPVFKRCLRLLSGMEDRAE